jgi:hypothetical protein
MRISAQKRSIRKKNHHQKESVRRNIILSLILCMAFFALGGLLYHYGIHTSLKLIVQGRFEELPEGSLRDSLEELRGMIRSEAAAYSGNNLPTLYLDIPFENMQVIQQKRSEALQSGILLSSDEDYVSAWVRYNESAPIDVQIRLKGDWTDHLEGDKWSYRIHIEDDAAIEGMTRFSIQAPETRNFLYEWGYHQALLREGLLAPRYFFVNLIENGENKGVFAVEESFYTELIESEQRRSGVIIRYDEDDMWQNWTTFFSNGREDMRTAAGQSGYFMQADFESATISGFGQGKIAGDPVLLEEYRTAQQMLRNYQNGTLSADQVFDMQQMGEFIAITEVWGAGHAIAWHNLRFYYNPVTNLLEPVAFDGIPMVEPYVSVNFAEDDPDISLLDDEAMRYAFFETIPQYLDETYITSLQDALGDEVESIATSLEKEYGVDVSIDWEKLANHQLYLQEQLQPENYVQVTMEYVPGSGFETSIRNTYFTDLVLKSITYYDERDHQIAQVNENVNIPNVIPALDVEKSIYIQLEEYPEVFAENELKVVFEFILPDGQDSFQIFALIQ